jgi:DNA-binding beta-propeller fold protein YncE
MFTRCLIFLGSVGLLIGAAALVPPADKKDGVPEYRVVADWPALPPDFTFGETTGVAVDANDRVYVFHRGKQPIMVFDQDGKFLRSWGDGMFKTAHGLKIDHQGNVWVTDIGHHLVHKFTPEGKLLLTLGTKDSPGVGKDQFNKPADTVVARDGNLYVADGYGNNRVVKFTGTGEYVKEWGKKGTGPGEFNLPHGILEHMGRIVVADRENDRVQTFTPEGQFIGLWKKPGAPFGLIPLDDRHWLLADGRAHVVKVLDAEGNVVGQFGTKGMAGGEFNLPHGICVDQKGAVYVTEIQGRRVQKFVAKR